MMIAVVYFSSDKTVMESVVDFFQDVVSEELLPVIYVIEFVIYNYYYNYYNRSCFVERQ